MAVASRKSAGTVSARAIGGPPDGQWRAATSVRTRCVGGAQAYLAAKKKNIEEPPSSLRFRCSPPKSPPKSLLTSLTSPNLMVLSREPPPHGIRRDPPPTGATASPPLAAQIRRDPARTRLRPGPNTEALKTELLYAHAVLQQRQSPGDPQPRAGGAAAAAPKTFLTSSTI
ncbi:hypothetical protein BRADI_4g34065v3 [Brachypodium distachyon]|uniref:Uncharacterized protein n=1 Tax=Brachypodium distachyon TaxID=15368 RepID=A0A0Q3ETI0_BRADI|nr:hypothetical protein BRADI_4g34065v3 [Brachypodium distachyon]KQJ90823.1 hypothetical protein BRADI_4g34065v3 [Brachypodium distachyon]KQJ90824.1 hypothetical protein BRADI_4g34065v3 [Brachypodium distachyon]PNT64857.1 hypothetical protein BRADI_4g34065v3 [Brachypodium distachyon]PNT64858.1 hypothetical protein BRADI_4g34065v3 [Brachypodium distachyon]